MDLWVELAFCAGGGGGHRHVIESERKPFVALRPPVSTAYELEIARTWARLEITHALKVL
jgi:hypothetical protein